MEQLVQKLNPRHFRILDLYLEGRPLAEIARMLEMTPQAVTIVTNSPIFKHELSLRRAQIEAVHTENVAFSRDLKDRDTPALEALRAGALQAAQRLVENTQHENGSVANRACEAILDRVGIGKVETLRVQEQSLHVNISADDARAIQDTLEMIKNAKVA